jgi:DNA repair protein RadC
MKELSLADRPREKLLTHGAHALGDNELVALVLGTGSRERDGLAVANGLLALRGGLHGLSRSSPADLRQVEGVGRAKAVQLVAAIELGRRTLTRPPGQRPQLRSTADSIAFLVPAFAGRPKEQVGVVLLDTKHRVLKTTIVSVGTLNSTIVEPRDLFREAVQESAAAVVVFHNHPSGDPTPSPDDRELTARLRASGIVLGVDVLDHIILGDARHYSFKERGYL